MVGKLAVSAIKNKDHREAEEAWQRVGLTRYFRIEKIGPSTLLIAVLPVASREILRVAHAAFINEFMLCRGWRQLPGSEEWV